jgi:hypothetical protein
MFHKALSLQGGREQVARNGLVVAPAMMLPVVQSAAALSTFRLGEAIRLRYRRLISNSPASTIRSKSLIALATLDQELTPFAIIQPRVDQ